MAEAAGFPITNRVHVSHVLGDTDLDFVVSRAEQDAWLAGKVSETPSDLCANIPTAYSQRLRFAQKFARLQLRPDYPELVGLLSRYVRTGILFPRRTGYSFWSLTCLPSTNAHTWPRLACVNVNMMEVFVVGHHLRAPEAVWGFVIVVESAFRACYPSDRVFARAWPGAWV